jgi:hypothetical protein
MSNSINLGDWGERFAVSSLSLAFRGQAKWVSLFGERQHLDLTLDFASPFDGANRSIQVQVKTGDSFGTFTKGRWRIDNIDREHVSHFQKSQQPVLLVWVRPSPRTRVYWRWLSPRSCLKTISISRHNLVCPATLFDIERMYLVCNTRKLYNLTLTLPGKLDFVSDRENAKQFWKNHKTLPCHNLGTVRLSRHGWRHMTRKSKSKSRMHDSLRLISILPALLSREAHDVELKSASMQVLGRIVTAQRTLLLKFRNIRFNKEGEFTVFVRVRVSQTFPRRWKEIPDGDWNLTHTTTIESVYRKLIQKK